MRAQCALIRGEILTFPDTLTTQGLGLEKPCWLLNYNEDDHNLTRLPNKIDLSIRMRQFFDHYLMNQAAPIWMIEGIPAERKGKISGY